MKSIVTTFKLSGLHCESCKKISEKRVKKIQGVEDADTDLTLGHITITSIREISKEEVEVSLSGTDYQVS